MDTREAQELTRAERRQLRIEFLMGEAKRLGMHLAPEDYEHEDFAEDLEELYMTEEQIEKMRLAEKEFIARRPPPAEPPPRVPEPVHAVANVVRLDNAVRTAVSTELKQRLMAYTPIERLYSLVTSWKWQRMTFDTAEIFGAHVARFGCTCIKKNTGSTVETWEFSLDMYYHQKKEDAEKKRRRRKEVRTALKVARVAQQMESLRVAAHGGGPRNSDSEDEQFNPKAALAAAVAPGSRAGVLRAPASSENIEQDEVPAYADDHVQLIVCLRHRTPPRKGVRVDDVYFVVRDSAF